MTSDTWMSPLCSLVFFCSCRDKMWDITITLWTEFNSSDGSSHKLMLIWMCVRFIWIHLFFYETMLCCCWVNKAHRWFTYRYLKKMYLRNASCVTSFSTNWYIKDCGFSPADVQPVLKMDRDKFLTMFRAVILTDDTKSLQGWKDPVKQ